MKTNGALGLELALALELALELELELEEELPDSRLASFVSFSDLISLSGVFFC